MLLYLQLRDLIMEHMVCVDCIIDDLNKHVELIWLFERVWGRALKKGMW